MSTSRLCIKNLPKHLTEERLKNIFEKFGKITDVKILKKNGRSRRFGFVGFKNIESSEKAKTHFNHTFIDTSKISVEFAHCLNEGDRPWSKYSYGSSLHKKLNPDKYVNRINKKDNKKTESELEINKGDEKEFRDFLNKINFDKGENNKSKIKKMVKMDINDDINENNKRIKNILETTKNNNIKSNRLYITNVPYNANEKEIEKVFVKYGDIRDVHIPLDELKRSKGFCFVRFEKIESAEKLMEERQSMIFQGRMIYLKYAVEENNRNVDIENENLTYKKIKMNATKKNAENEVTWNSLFLRPDTVVSAISEKDNIKKGDLINREDKSSNAVNLALAETSLISETQLFLSKNAINSDILQKQISKSHRSKNIILIKNLPYSTQENELRSIFDTYGTIGRLLLAPSKTLAIIEYLETNEAKKAFKNLAYKKFKHVPLYLEWAPIKFFSPIQNINRDDTNIAGNIKHTIYIKNLNFKTKETKLKQIFSKYGKLRHISIKKNSNKKSMGYGFVEYQSKQGAKLAMKYLQEAKIDGHQIHLEYSKEKKEFEIKKFKNKKIIVKNLAFEANAKELEALFSEYGAIKSCRIPVKMTGEHRGFGFVEFITSSEAINAFKALRNTHLYGRHIILEWAKEEG